MQPPSHILTLYTFWLHTSPHLLRLATAATTSLPVPLQSLEGAIWGLQESQSEGMRRLNSGLATALGDAELALQVPGPWLLLQL